MRAGVPNPFAWHQRLKEIQVSANCLEPALATGGGAGAGVIKGGAEERVCGAEAISGLSQFGMRAFDRCDPLVHPASAETIRITAALPGFNTASFCETAVWTQALIGPAQKNLVSILLFSSVSQHESRILRSRSAIPQYQ